jgi:hypothetical protein
MESFQDEIVPVISWSCETSGEPYLIVPCYLASKSAVINKGECELCPTQITSRSLQLVVAVKHDAPQSHASTMTFPAKLEK